MVKQTFDSTAAGEGHRLSSENNTNTAMDIDELRARRLAALSSSSSSSTGANTYSRKTTTTSTTINGTQNNESTMYSTHTTENNNINNNSTSSSSNNKAVDVKESKSKQPSSSSSSLPSSPSSSSGVICIEPLVTSSLDSLIHEFNSIMWDDNITTHADKIRWVEQGIHTNILIQDRDSNSNTKNNADGSRNITQHDSWGLQQSHGGPCGVLAALQAELISRLNIVQDNNNNHNDGRQIIQMPIIAKEYTVEDIQKALADSIACILVRACIAPTMMQKKDHTTAAAAAAAGNIDITDDNDDNEFCVRLFLPKNNDDCKSGTNDLIASEDLLSLYSGNNRSTTNTKQMKLQCVSIKYNHYNDEEVSKTPEAKRAKAATSTAAAAAAAVKTTTTTTTTTILTKPKIMSAL